MMKTTTSRNNGKTCPICHKQFRNVQSHLTQSECRQFPLNGDFDILIDQTIEVLALPSDGIDEVSSHGHWADTDAHSLLSDNDVYLHTNENDNVSIPNDNKHFLDVLLNDGTMDNEAILVCPTDYSFYRIFPSEEAMSIEIMHLLDRANTPQYVADELLSIVKKYGTSNRPINYERITKRSSTLQRLSKQFSVPKPTTIPIGIECSSSYSNLDFRRQEREHVTITRFDFLEQLRDLLFDNSIWCNMDNFSGTINVDDPFKARPPRTDGYVDEVVDGNWYARTYQQCHDIVGSDDFLLFGIIAYCDKTGIDCNQRYGLEPLSFTLTIFNRQTRYSPKAWRILGYIPDVDSKSSTAKQSTRGSILGKSRSCRNYHLCLSHLLDPLIQSQGLHKPIYEVVRFGNRVKRCRVFFPFAFMIGDSQSSDKMCGRYLGYSNVARICRACDVTPQESDDTSRTCRFVSSRDLENLSVKALKCFRVIPFDDGEHVPTNAQIEVNKMRYYDQLKNLSHHMHLNAFSAVWFGDNPNGICGATPHDLMHAFLHGILTYVVQLLMSPLLPSELRDIDQHVDRIFVHNHNSQRGTYPRCNFTRGISQLKMLTANDWAGVAFALSLVACSKQGRNILQKASDRSIRKYNSKGFDHNLAYNDDGSSLSDDDSDDFICHTLCTPNKILYMLEMLLSFHAWYRRGQPFPANHRVHSKSIDRAIRQMLQTVKDYVPRTDASGWKLQKFHDHLHILRDMKEYGSPGNWDTGPGEHSLIDSAKKPGQRSWKKQSVFVEQVGLRTIESATIRKAYNALIASGMVEAKKLSTNDSINDEPQNITCTSLCTITFPANSRHPIIRWIHANTKGMRELHPVVISFFADISNFPNANPSMRREYHIVSEISCGEIIVRAHPNYKSNGPWYDWVMVRFEVPDDIDTGDGGHFGRDFFPSKVYCLFKEDGNDTIYFLIQSCDYSDHKEDSILYERWHKHYNIARNGRSQWYVPDLQSVEIDCIGKAVFVVEDNPIIEQSVTTVDLPDESGITLVLPYDDVWPKMFL